MDEAVRDADLTLSCINTCIHDLFEAQVRLSPDATAALSGRVSLTYRELDERANRLAHLLRERGVGPEVLVGLCVDRSLEMLVGVLAILKTGEPMSHLIRRILMSGCFTCGRTAASASC